MKSVIGNYENVNDALTQVNSLLNQGYPTDSISVIASKSDANMFWNTGVTVEPEFESVDGVGEDTLWARIKAFFAGDNAKIRDANLMEYRDSIMEGNVLVLVDDDMLPETLTENVTTANVVTGDDKLTYATYDEDADEETLRLREERMNVEKQAYKAGEVTLHKRVVEETKTVEVPVWHEEVVIERHAVTDGDYVGDTNFDDETITIPVMAEEIEVTKHPYVTEEIKVHKRDIEHDQEASATLRKEYLDVDRTGETVIVDENNRK